MFTHLLNQDKQVVQNVYEYGSCVSETNEKVWLSYCGTGDLLLYPFQPQKLFMAVSSGRIYHEGPNKLGGMGLIKSSLGIELSNFFVYEATDRTTPVGFKWKGSCYKLCDSMGKHLKH